MTVRPRMQEFLAAFRADAGVLPDGLVVDSNKNDWATALSSLRVAGWEPAWSDGRGPVGADLLDGPDHEVESFFIRPTEGVLVNFFPGDDVVFDIDLREITTEPALAGVLDVVERLGDATAKVVTLSEEGTWDWVAVRYDPTTKEFWTRAAERR